MGEVILSDDDQWAANQMVDCFEVFETQEGEEGEEWKDGKPDRYIAAGWAYEEIVNDLQCLGEVWKEDGFAEATAACDVIVKMYEERRDWLYNKSTEYNKGCEVQS